MAYNPGIVSPGQGAGQKKPQAGQPGAQPTTPKPQGGSKPSPGTPGSQPSGLPADLLTNPAAAAAYEQRTIGAPGTIDRGAPGGASAPNVNLVSNGQGGLVTTPGRAVTPTAGNVLNPALASNPQVTPAPGVGAPSFQDWLNTQFGGGNPFGMQGNYSDINNPMYAAATRAYQQGLAGTRSHFGASGMGNSAREALAEGDAASNYGAQIAALGQQAYQNDANRALAAYQAGTGSNLAMNQQQAGIGNLLNQIGLNEQNLPMLNAMMQLFQTFFGSTGSGTTAGSTSTGYSFG